MYQYPKQATDEATHTDENGFMYKKVTESFVMYWDRRFNGWFQEMSKNFDFLIPYIKQGITIMDTGYLQHGDGTFGYFCTEPVKIKQDVWPKADSWLAHYDGKWRKVHVQVNRTFIIYAGEKITIKIGGV